MAEKAKRLLSRAAKALLMIPLGPLGSTDVTSHSPKQRVGQDAAHRKLGTSQKGGDKAPLPKPKGKSGKHEMPKKRGKPFQAEGSLVHFSLR